MFVVLHYLFEIFIVGMSLCFLLQASKSLLFSSLESSSATSRVQFGTECQMMPEDVYVKHVTEKLSEGEGRLTKVQANIQWYLAI